MIAIMTELIFLALLLIPCLAVITLYMLLSYNPCPKRTIEYMIKDRYKFNPEGKEEAFESLIQKGNIKSVADVRASDASVYLTVIVPAMNERIRLPSMLNECLDYLEKRAQESPEFTYEVIVVDDGSTDQTSELVFDYTKTHPVSVLKLNENIGKGGAVRCGVLCARGSLILFADADNATQFSDFAKLEKLCNDSGTDKVIVVGSRAHLQKDSVVKRTVFRTVLMFGFHALVYFFTVRTIKDTQCGFKLFTRSAAVDLFPRIHVERWAFDIELLYLAQLMHIPVKEIGVQWHEVDGSKINPLQASFEMARDILLIWSKYTLGIWKI